MSIKATTSEKPWLHCIKKRTTAYRSSAALLLPLKKRCGHVQELPAVTLELDALSCFAPCGLYDLWTFMVPAGVFAHSNASQNSCDHVSHLMALQCMVSSRKAMTDCTNHPCIASYCRGVQAVLSRLAWRMCMRNPSILMHMVVMVARPQILRWFRTPHAGPQTSRACPHAKLL